MTISFLSGLIAFKILVTFLFVCLPFLVLTTARLSALTGVSDSSGQIFRLYGVAILGLLIGYATAFPTLNAGSFPWGIVAMGVISNGGATLVLSMGRPSVTRRLFAPLYGSIFVALVLSMIFPDIAMGL